MNTPGQDAPSSVAAQPRGRPSALDLASDEPGLPAPQEVVDRLAEAAHRTTVDPAGERAAVRLAASGYVERRVLPTSPGRVVFAPGGRAVLPRR